MRRYVSQPHLHAQAHWLVDVWLEALEGVTYVDFAKKKEGVSLGKVLVD